MEAGGRRRGGGWEAGVEAGGRRRALPLVLSTVATSLAVMVPCSFWPLSSLASISSHVPSPLAKASAHLRLRPPKPAKPPRSRWVRLRPGPAPSATGTAGSGVRGQGASRGGGMRGRGSCGGRGRTGGDEVSQAAALHEGVVLHAREEHLRELGRLLEAYPDDGGLGVAAQAEAVAEARAERDDVLERAAQLDARHVVDGADAEGGAVEKLLEDLAVGLALEADRRLAELVLGHCAARRGTAAGSKAAGSAKGPPSRSERTTGFAPQPPSLSTLGASGVRPNTPHFHLRNHPRLHPHSTSTPAPRLPQPHAHLAPHASSPARLPAPYARTFVGDVGAHEDGDVHAVHVLLDEVGDEHGAAVLELDALAHTRAADPSRYARYAVLCGAVRCRAVEPKGRWRTLMSETARQPLAMPVIWGQIRPRNCHEVGSTERQSNRADGGRCHHTGGLGTLGRVGERRPRHLVRQHKDEQGGTLNRVRQVGVGDHVVRELDALPNGEPTA